MNRRSGERTVKERMRLKDGRTVRIREARVSDRELFLGFFAGLSGQSRHFMGGWSKASACTPEHAERLAGKIEGEDHFALVVVDGAGPAERIVGYCWIDDIGRKDAMPMLGIGIVDEYQEVGLGKALLETMIEEGRRLGLERIKLGLWDDNPRAIHVYEAVGFRPDPAIPAQDFDGRTEIYLVVATGDSERQRSE